MAIINYYYCGRNVIGAYRPVTYEQDEKDRIGGVLRGQDCRIPPVALVFPFAVRLTD